MTIVGNESLPHTYQVLECAGGICSSIKLCVTFVPQSELAGCLLVYVHPCLSILRV